MITYFDTSILMKLLIDGEPFGPESERLWVESDFAVCAEIGYVEARAALAAVRRDGRLSAAGLRIAKDQLELLWEQMSVVVVDRELVRAAGDLAEVDALRGHDAVHLAAAVAGEVTVVASADRQLVEAARAAGVSPSRRPRRSSVRSTRRTLAPSPAAHGVDRSGGAAPSQTRRR